jgi:hypothetical protein
MQSSSLMDDPSHWQKRAEEALRVADQLDDPSARETMSAIAQSYQQLAAMAQAKLSRMTSDGS